MTWGISGLSAAAAALRTERRLRIWSDYYIKTEAARSLTPWTPVNQALARRAIEDARRERDRRLRAL